MDEHRSRVDSWRGYFGWIWLWAMVGGCSLSFDPASLPRRPTDSGIDAADAVASGMDANVCGDLFHPCCAGDGSVPRCNGNLVCTGGYCQNCGGGFAACNGICADTQLDPQNCGSCAHVCADRQACSAGVCHTVCPTGQTDCNGRCVFTGTDPTACGRCDNVCTFSHGAARCERGVCALGACDTGWGDCDNRPANGCETNLTDTVGHCGSCATACSFANASATCAAGVCVMGTCASGWADCDGLSGNGCETNTGSDAAHCGGCATACGTTQRCVAGACMTSTTVCPSGQADCLGNTHCENLSTDASNCGACGAVCALANATVICVSGACGIAACAMGFGDCDHNPTNGCEVNLSTNVSNCNTCGNNCVFPHASASCVGGTCQMGTCDTGWGNCDGMANNGCETNLASATANCGACGNTCAFPNAAASCAMGVCVLGACTGGYANCNGLSGDGCEAALATDPGNCGMCHSACTLANSTPACSSGTCQLGMCLPGYADCNGVASDGCEVSLMTDPTHCGSCATACSFPHATALCTGGACGLGTCLTGWLNCNGVASDGCEVSILTSVTNCGMCGHACGHGQVCSNGACTNDCSGMLSRCGSTCANTNTDPLNCGDCGTVCPGGTNASPACSGGECALTCNAGWGNCAGGGGGGCTTSLTADVNNCGACGTVCPAVANATPTCTSSRCGFVCLPGYADCDGNPTNGCEVALASTVNHCGSCGVMCPTPANATPVCTAGTCGFTCMTGWGDCDGNPTNGCETNLTSNVYNCGGCGTRCWYANATGRCMGGVCQLGACGSNFADCNHLSADGCETDLGANPNSCGGCGTACNPPPSNNQQGVCHDVGGGHWQCTATCLDGFFDCDGHPGNGCEANLRQSPNCGACGTTCALSLACGSRSCLAVACGIETYCAASNECTSTSTDITNCGSCGTGCVSADGAGVVCNVGSCVTVCSGSMADCDRIAANGCEVDTRTNPMNCGACGSACGTGQYCALGRCCQWGQVVCGTNCVDVSTDTNNCGMCGNHCATGQSCTAGMCVP